MRRSTSPGPLRLALSIGALALSGCAFMTTDVYRPLVVAEFPDETRTNELRARYFDEADSEQFRKSLALTRAAWDFFDIQKYGSFYADLDIERLVNAIELHPDNAFAWTQLGAYLALQHRPGAAAEATGRALEILDGLEDVSESPELIELEQISAINAGIYRNASGQHRAALDALARIEDARELSPFHRLAFYWTAAQAFTGAGDLQRSGEALARAEETARQGLGSSPAQSDYPQYFRAPKREAVFRYLEASNLRSAGRYDEAIKRLDEALESDPKLWDALFLRSLAHRESGALGTARTELQRLITSVPRKLFRREVVHYHLALVQIDRQELLEAEYHLQFAVQIVRHDNQRLEEIVEGLTATASGTEAPLATRAVLEAARGDEGWVFAPAYEALGEAYLELVSRRASAGRQPHWTKKAEEMFELALGERSFPAGSGLLLPGTSRYQRRHVTLTKLGRLHWEQGEYEPFLERFRQALEAAPGYAEGLASLLALASQTPEPEVARRAYDLVLERLPLELAPFGVQTTAGEMLAEALSDAPQASGSAELRHLEARLLLLSGELAAAEEAFRAADLDHVDALWPVVGQAWIELNRSASGEREIERRLGDRLLALGETSKPWERRDAYFVRGELRLLGGDADGALEDFRLAESLMPGWQVAREGIRLAEQKRAESAASGSRQ